MGVPVYKRILDLFEAEGVDTLFGIPDPNFVHMFSEADARGWSVVAPHHELSAGFMAEAASRMTGKPGLCIGTLGPGVANISGAMMCTLVENSPVIFLGGQRARNSFSSRAFSMAMTACLAKLLRSSICLSLKSCTSLR